MQLGCSCACLQPAAGASGDNSWAKLSAAEDPCSLPASLCCLPAGGFGKALPVAHTSAAVGHQQELALPPEPSAVLPHCSVAMRRSPGNVQGMFSIRQFPPCLDLLVIDCNFQHEQK